jgi:hypothetical protein
MFLQTAVVLFDRAPGLDEVAECCSKHAEVRRVVPAQPDDANYWLAGEGTVVVPTDSGANGALAIQPLHRAWPDGMGSPEEDPGLFGAWVMRYFGIGTFPLGLARAAAVQSSAGDGAPSSEHDAFVRLNLSYVMGADDDALVSPNDRDVGRELVALARSALPLLALPGARAWYAPNGEVLLPLEQLARALERQASGEFSPELWVSLRSYAAGKHVMLETVGISALSTQPLEARDHQLVLPAIDVELHTAERFLLELSGVRHYGRQQLPTEPVLGPGGRWSASLAKSDNPPPREMVRWTHDSDAGSDWAVADVSQDHAERWSAHLSRHLGPSHTVFHELISDNVHLDVLVFAATAERPYHVLVTQGMSARPMTVPEGAEQAAFAELMVVLPADWVIEGPEASQERWYWPMRALKFTARLPHLYGTWIGWGHTIPNDDPARPYADGTELCCVMAASPRLFDESLQTCEVAPGKTVLLYALFALLEDEMKFKLEHGAEALLERFDARQITELIDPSRRSALAKRFWLV